MSAISDYLYKNNNISEEDYLYNLKVSKAKELVYRYFRDVRGYSPSQAQSKCRTAFSALAYAKAIQDDDIAQIESLLKATKPRG